MGAQVAGGFLDAGFWMLDLDEEQAVSYRTLEIWQMARAIAADVHRMTIENLPKFEMFELGSQIRRSAHSVRSNIVEGYGRRRYKQEFIRFLTYALASCDETTDHLEALFAAESLKDGEVYNSLHARLNNLGRKLNSFLQAVEAGHQSVRESVEHYPARSSARPDGMQNPYDDVAVHPASRIQNPVSDIPSRF